MKECPACRHCFSDEFNNCPTDGDTLTRTIVGETVLDNRYQLDRRLGQGGMGIVFKARHIFLKTSYAIKVILPDLVGNDPMLATRFRQEAMVAARIRHRNIVNVTDFGVTSGGMPYLVMDLIKGKSLQELLTEQGRLSPECALEIMAAVGAGVGAAHQQGIVHRDLKPLNIMLQDDLPYSEGVKVLDFGLAKIKSGEFLGSFVAAQTTGLMGSPFYMAPELWSDEEPDKRVDVYSLGVILFQILTGDLPFKGASIPAIMNKHMTLPPPSLVTRGVNVPEAMDAVVRHALAKKREDRLSSVEAFLSELREAVLAAKAGFVRQAAVDFQTIPMFPPETVSGENERGTSSMSRGEVSREESTLPDSQERIEHEADRLRHEFEEAQRRADEAGQRAAQAARRRAEQEAARSQAEEEAARKLAEEEAARKRGDEAARRQAEEVAGRQRAEEQAALRLAEEEVRKRAEEEKARKRSAEEAARFAREIAEAQRRAEEARLLAEEEARRRTEEEAARWRAEEKARQLAAEVEEVQRRAEEARQRAEDEASKRAEQEEARKLVEAEVARERAEAAARMQAEEETTRKRGAEEVDRLAGEVAEAQLRADEARQRAEEEARKRVIEEEARKRAEEEVRRLGLEVAEAQRRAEEGARKRAEQEERTFALQAVAEQRLAEKTARDSLSGAAQQRVSLQSHPIGPEQTWQQNQPSVDVSVPNFNVEKKRKSVFSIIVSLGVALIVIVLAITLAVYRSRKPSVLGSENPRVQDTNSVKIEGGTFQMGRSDVALDAAVYESSKAAAFAISQYPAHAMSVKTFWMDKTEVTNEEYAGFIRATHQSPPPSWNNGGPPPGRLQWPVTEVSLYDAKNFAEWRSQRDHKTWRLPTEEEWEYVARNGAQDTFYPWGNQWLDDHANVDSSGLKPVGSYPQGAPHWGVLDLIGNAWEWTSTKAARYPGNSISIFNVPEGQFVIRGGGYVDHSRGDDAITATRRAFLPPLAKEAIVGFRLVRDEP